jgi:hypothetical protein
MRRLLLTVFCVVICSEVAGGGAAAKPKACDGLIIKRAKMVMDQGQIGVLDAGDLFRVRFQRPFSSIFAPDSEVGFAAADGQTDTIFNSNGDFGFTVTSRKSVTVTISEFDLGGGPVDIALPLPVSITTFGLLVDKKGNALPTTVSACSRDAVLG